MRFQVPQFIEKESKVIGPLTLRQFAWYVCAALIFVFVQFFLSGTYLFIAAAVLLGIATALAYLKINEVPLSRYFTLAFGFFMSDKKYIFKNKDQEPTLPHAN